MPKSAATFVVHRHDRARIETTLIELGFQVGIQHVTTTTVLDTFDGRLHRADLRLEFVQTGADQALLLSGGGVVAVRVDVTSIPRFVSDLPSGPFRNRVADVVEMRALLPAFDMTATVADAVWRDAAGKIVATATLRSEIVVSGQTNHDGPIGTVELHRTTGFDKGWERMYRAVERLGLERSVTDTVTSMASDAHVDLRGHVDSPSVPLEAADSAVIGFRDVLWNLADSVEANWDGTVDAIDTEFLHDLRVAVRRTRAVLAQGKNVLPADVVGAGAQRFSQLGAATGPARDLDVYLLEWNGYTQPLGDAATHALEPVKAILVQRSVVAQAELVEQMHAAHAAGVMRAWRAELQTVADHPSPGPNADRQLGRVVTARIRKAHETLIHNGRQIGEHSAPEELHDLRKDAKKLRYLFECFGTLLEPDHMKRFVKRLKKFQDNLGEHQDAEVHADLMRQIAGELGQQGTSPQTFAAIEKLTERLDQVLLRTRAEFDDRFATYDSDATNDALDEALGTIDR